jgi:hypothetical protein
VTPITRRKQTPAHAEIFAEAGVTGFERRLFDGAVEPIDGMLRPDLSRTGLGLELQRADASRYAA